jgi:putative oxygen-independent coproporphyrinogen III oxidase
MAGIYLHIPFCRQKCHYCNFYSTVSVKYHDSFIDVLKKEIISRKDYLEDQEVSTIYFGGGTPSMLTINDISVIINLLYSTFNVSDIAEITFEANPDDISKEKLYDLKKYTPINRFSMGIQSFFDDDLHYLNRVHNSNQAKKSIELVNSAGYNNLTIDLIYGIPTLTDEKWRKNLDIFFDFEIPHLSSYSLTVESKTALDTLIKNNKLPNISESQSIGHFNILLDQMTRKRYSHYEISNFALEGYYSKHNSNYWLGGHYLGLGPSAHSYNGKSRQWNIKSIKNYCDSVDISKIIDEKEILSTDQMYNEYILTSLRTSWGCDSEHIANVFGTLYKLHFISGMENYIKEDKIIKSGNVYTLTNKGKLFADGISSVLFR